MIQETRLYDPDRNETRAMRTKEDAHDYRYFPDPDLPPLQLSEQFIENVRQELPELPDAKKLRFIDQYHLNPEDAEQLTMSKDTADYFESAMSTDIGSAKIIANWINTELASYLNEENRTIKESPVSADMLRQLIKRIQDNTISGKIAKEVFKAMWAGQGSPDDIIEKKGLKQITDSSAIEQIIDEVLANSQAQIEQYKNGQEKVFGYFVGQVMKATQGKANPQQVNTILREKLK